MARKLKKRKGVKKIDSYLDRAMRNYQNRSLGKVANSSSSSSKK